MASLTMEQSGLSPDEWKRHLRACKKASRMDSLFFSQNPDRQYRVRPSIPFEDIKSTDAEAYDYWNTMLVWRDPDWQWHGRLVHAKPNAPLPDNDFFLAALWLRIELEPVRADRPAWDLPAFEHLGLLAINEAVNGSVLRVK